jgi:membrane fusion protein (multidrug efflux system)
MTVKLSAQVTDALLIPEQAVVPEQGRTFVFVVEDGVASKREVTIGRRRPGEVEVAGGLNEHERVIVDGTQKVRDQVRVQEVAQTGPAAS